MSKLFRGPDLMARISDGHRYHEFLRVAAMSAGIYSLPAGVIDTQTRHQEDEIYYVIRGAAKMRLGMQDRLVREGDAIFVEKNLEHRFFDITEELVLFVVFTPAENA